MNLGKVCLFSNLITTLVHWCGFWDGAVGASRFFTSFKAVIYWWMIKISKRMGILKRGRIKYQAKRIRSVFLNHYSVFVPEYSFPNDQCYYLFLIFK